MTGARLIIGDCLDVLARLEPGSVDLVLADPPYGTTQNKWDSVIPLDRMWAALWRVVRGNGAVVMTAAQPFSSTLVVSNLADFKYEWIWRKSKVTGVLNAKKQPLRQHESVLVFYRNQPTYAPQGVTACSIRASTGNSARGNSANYGAITQTDDGKYLQTVTNYPRSVVEIASEGATVHPTQKPVALMEYLIRTYSNQGDLVLDFTMGSGTTGVAALRCGRRFIGIEMDPHYAGIAARRCAA